MNFKETGIVASLRRGVRSMCSRKLYLFAIVVVPVMMLVFFVTLFGEGLPMKVPSAIVDLDHSQMSREITRNLNATELIDVKDYCESYDDALAAVRRGDIVAFFVIPHNFSKDVGAGKTPTVEYYTNMTYFVPATLSFKGFKTVAVTTTGQLVTAKLVALGADPEQVSAMTMPVAIQDHGIANPWTNYSYYLCPSFMAGLLALMVLIVTAFSITDEIKKGTSPEWLRTARGSMGVALFGKLLPQTIAFTAVAVLMESVFFHYLHFPQNGSMGWLILAIFLMIVACQFFAIFVCSVVPNPRIALSICSLMGILSFSFTGFSFPMENMYGWIAIFGYAMPVRYYFMIYATHILNGFDIFYCRLDFVALLVYPLIGWLLCGRLRKACLRPVYVP